MQHVVTRPAPPFRSQNGLLEVHQVPAAQDNLSWLIVYGNREAAAVDGPSADPVLKYCKENNLRLTTLLNTHTHYDHIGINHELERAGLLSGLQVIGPAKRASEVPGLTIPAEEGHRFQLGGVSFEVWLTEGHIDGHISFIADDLLFCGDTLFGAGCGYLFDGPPEKMFRSLSRLRALPPATRVCCAHEYTQDNLRFAFSVEPQNQALAARIQRTWQLRARGESSVPSRIELERATNPFLRFDAPDIQASLLAAWPGRRMETELDFFTATRELKDRKDYRQLSDAALPLASESQ